MKTVHIILGVLMFLIFMVGSASALTLTNTNIDLPSGASVRIDVTYNADADTITFLDSSTGVTNPRITWIAYNLDIDEDQIIGYKRSSDGVDTEWEELTTWDEKKNFGSKGEFGDISRVYALKNPNDYFSKVVVKLKAPGFDGSILGNTLGNQVGVHFVCDQFSCFVAGPTPEKPPTPDTPIPEFSSIAIPVAAVLGLLFISGRRRKE